MRQNLRHSRFKLLLKGTQTFALNCYTTVLETTMVENIKQNVVWFKWNPTLWPYYCQSLTDPCKWDQTPVFFVNCQRQTGAQDYLYPVEQQHEQGSLQDSQQSRGYVPAAVSPETPRWRWNRWEQSETQRSSPHSHDELKKRRITEISETYHLTQTTVIWNCIVPFTMKLYHKKKKKNRKGKHK